MFTHLYRQSISFILSTVLLGNTLYAEGIVVDTAAAISYRPMLESTANAIPLINIVTPNTSGLSHNKFSEFNIEQHGVIFNNATSAVQTQLGGWVQGNANLGTTPARVILNEVTGTSRSLLRGYGEVAGHRADLIIANPNGITVNGGGFINTPRATLTTGMAILSGDTLEGFHVQRGDILIEGDGINASNIDQVELYTKALVLNAQIHAKKLDTVTGENTIARDGTVTSDNVIGSEEFSIDSSALGGIYADTIRLVGTDRGVGVNLPQITYASDSLELTVDGRIILGTAIAENTLRTKSASLTLNDKMYSSDIGIIVTETMTNNGAVIADTLNITGGDVTNNGGMIGGTQLSIHGRTITNNEVLYSANAIDLSAVDILRNTEGSMIRSAGSLTMHNTGTVRNEAALIEADGNVVIQANAVENLSSTTPIKSSVSISSSLLEYLPGSFRDWRGTTITTDTIDKTGYIPSYILSGGDMLIDAAIYNRYSMIAADGDLYLSGSLNNEAALNAHNVIDISHYVEHYEKHGKFGHHAWYHNYSYYEHSDTIIDHLYSTIQAGGSIFGNLISVNNADVVEGSVPTNTSSEGIPASPFFSDISVGSHYTLPNGNYGQYITVNDPSHLYLIESNPLYTDFNTFISSDYIMSRLHLDTAANTKRLGDARYETQLVRDAVFRLTGERYLAGFGSDTTQYQALMDNALAVNGDLHLELGVSLSATQIAALNRDIVWMEDQVISGQHVLVPIVYLASLTNQELTSSGKIIAGDDMQLAVLEAINNAGEIRAGGTLLAQADTMTNTAGSIKSASDMLLHTVGDMTNTSGTIRGNNVALISDNGNIVSQTALSSTDLNKYGGTSGNLTSVGEKGGIWSQENLVIQAAKDITLIGTETSSGGNIALSADNVTLSSLEQDTHYKTTWSQGSSEIESVKQHSSALAAGGDVSINAAKDVTLHSSALEGTNVALSAGENINITASNNREFMDVKSSYKGTLGSGSSRDMNLKESVVSSTINGDNIAITSGKETTLQAAKLKATDNIQVDAVGDINILAKAYREASLHQESKSSFGGLVSSASLDSTDALKLREATVKTEAKNIIMNSGKDINVVASDMSAGDALGLKANKDINIISDEEQNTEQHYSKKSGLSLGFSDGMLTVAEEKQTQDAKANITQKSSNLSGKTVAVAAGQDVTSIGSNVTASTININAQRDVNILSATESASQEHKESIAKVGIGVTLNMNEASIFAGVIAKSDKLGEGQTGEVSSQLFGDNIIVHSGNNANILASNVIAKNDVTIESDKNTNILSQDATAYKNQVHEELKAGIKVGVEQHVTEAAKQLTDTAKSLPDSDNVVSAGSKVLKSIDLITNTLSNSVSVGFDAIAEMSKSETSSQSISAQSSIIAAGHNVALDANKEITVVGSDILAENEISINAETMTLKSSAQNASSSSSDKSGSIKVTLFGTREGQVDASYAQSKNRSNDTTQRDTYVRGNDVIINTSGDTTLQGAHVSGNTITANVGGNLNLISVQDTGSSNGDSESISISTARSVSVGAGKSSSSKAWVNEQTGLIAAEKADITVAKNTDLQGAIIATKDTNGNDVNNVHLTTGTLSASDISDHDTSTSMNIGIGNISASQFQADSKGTTGATLEAGYANSDKEQINRATIGGGTIALANQETLPTTLNRDISKAQEITKDESANYDIYASQNSVNSVLNPTQTAENWKQAAKDMGLSVYKEITENLPNGDSGGLAGMVGKGLDAAGGIGLLPSQGNGGGYITQIATQLFGDNRTGIIVENKETLLKAGVSKDDIQEVILIKTEKGVKKAEDFKDTDTVLDTVTVYRTDPNKTVIIGDPNDKTGDPSLENYKIRLSAEDVKNSGIDHLFTNGMFNSIETATYNQQTQQGRADSILNYNQQHGIIGDLLESAQDALAVNTGLSALGTGGARQTGEVIDQIATITNGNLTVGAHSQGTLMSQVGMEKNKEHLQELVQGNKDSKFLVGYAGSPVNHTIAEELITDIYGGKQAINDRFKNDEGISNVFRSQVNPEDAVGSVLGYQSAGINNSENLGNNVWESFLATPRLFGIGGDSSHSYYPCVIGCGNENYTPDIKNYYTPDSKDGVKEHSRVEYYQDNFTNKDGKMTINMDLLPQTNKSDSIQQSTQTVLDTTKGQ